MKTYSFIFCIVAITVHLKAHAEVISHNLSTTAGHVPMAQGWSGGWCLASMAEAGWIRSTILSSRMSEILTIGPKSFPLITGTTSGGSMFATRFFVLRNNQAHKLWNYPCYLLTRPYSIACFFHGSFGAISSECYAETFNVMTTASSIAYGSIIASYGGPIGVAATYLGVYFPFLADLPIKAPSMQWQAFTRMFVEHSTFYDVPVNWLVAHTLDAPELAGNTRYDYGFNSFLSRAASSFHGKGFVPTQFNMSVAWMITVSANTQTGMAMLPFALAGKSWDRAGAAANGVAKLFTLVVSFTMVKKMLLTHNVMDSSVITATDPSCVAHGCPIFDGGFTDNAPLTPVLSQGVLMASNLRPSWFLSVGAASTMGTVKYLMGTGPLHVYSMGSINICPFTIAGVCDMLARVRDLMVMSLPKESAVAYYDLGSTFQVFRPEVRLMAPYCADPLTYDLFAGKCAADGMCDMWSVVIPSRINKIAFTPETVVFVFLMVYLQQTPVSSRFVNLYAPQEMWQIEYYAHMDAWFPNFDAVAPSKGGVGFTNIAGNSFMDFMTYLNIRLAAYLVKTKLDATEIVQGSLPTCHYTEYKKVENGMLSNSAAFQLPSFR